MLDCIQFIKELNFFPEHVGRKKVCNISASLLQIVQSVHRLDKVRPRLDHGSQLRNTVIQYCFSSAHTWNKRELYLPVTDSVCTKKKEELENI